MRTIEFGKPVEIYKFCVGNTWLARSKWQGAPVVSTFQGYLLINYGRDCAMPRKPQSQITMSLYQDDEENTLADFGLHQLSAPLNPNGPIDQAPTPPAASAFLHLQPNPPFSKPISDPDLFLSSLYNYYHQRGLGPIIASGIVELFSLFFTLYLSYVIGACLDWSSLNQCHDENSCSENFTG